MKNNLHKWRNDIIEKDLSLGNKASGQSKEECKWQLWIKRYLENHPLIKGYKIKLLGKALIASYKI